MHSKNSQIQKSKTVSYSFLLKSTMICQIIRLNINCFVYSNTNCGIVRIWNTHKSSTHSLSILLRSFLSSSEPSISRTIIPLKETRLHVINISMAKGYAFDLTLLKCNKQVIKKQAGNNYAHLMTSSSDSKPL